MTLAIRPNKVLVPQQMSSLSSTNQKPRRKTSIACQACKTRKAKCSGPPSPCYSCKMLGIECVIDITKDRRRHISQHHSKMQLEALQEDISELVHCIKRYPSTHVQSILDLVPEGVSAQERAAVIQRLLPDISKSFLEQHSSGSQSTVQDDASTIVEEETDIASPFDFESPVRSDDYVDSQHFACSTANQPLTGQGPIDKRAPPSQCYTPNIIPDNSAISHLYNLYYQGAKQMLNDGVNWQEVLGPGDDVSVDLLFRKRAASDYFDCSTWACELCQNLHGVDISVKMALVFLVTRMMRWLLIPTPENYSKVPDMMKPTIAQVTVPHPAILEIIPIPSVRDTMLRHKRDWSNFSKELQLSVSWSASIDEAFEIHPVTQSRILNARFIKHITTLSNWSIHPDFLNIFPSTEKSSQSNFKIRN